MIFVIAFVIIAVAVLLLGLCRMAGDSDDRMDALIKRLQDEAEDES